MRIFQWLQVLVFEAYRIQLKRLHIDPVTLTELIDKNVFYGIHMFSRNRQFSDSLIIKCHNDTFQVYLCYICTR